MLIPTLTLLSLLLVSSCYSVQSRTTLPIRHPNTVLQSSENGTCPSNDSLARSRLNEAVATEIRNRVVPALQGQDCSGRTRDDPGDSCKAIYDCSLGLYPSGSYWITDDRGVVVQVTCNMETTLCGTTGGWMEVAKLDMSDPTQVCPSGWRYFSSPVRSCGRTDTGGEGTETVTYSTHGRSFSRVCGKIVAYQYGRPDGFDPYTSSKTIDDVYVDGITITYGRPRQHIWTFAALKGDSDTGGSVCPCSDPDSVAFIDIPPWVGTNYFCEAGTNNGVTNTFYFSDPLFDGQNCPSPSTCCEFNTPPWFSRELARPSTGDLEVRVMGNYDDEDNPISYMEMWIQ